MNSVEMNTRIKKQALCISLNIMDISSGKNFSLGISFLFYLIYYSTNLVYR